MYFSDWLVGLRSTRPVVRVRRHVREAVLSAQIGRLEPRVMLTAQPVAPAEDSAALIARLEAAGAVIDAIPPVDPNLFRSQEAEVPAEGPFPDSDTFLLHSRPSATKVIYLDFDGHVTTGTQWNISFNRQTITTPTWDFEGGAGTVTPNEHTRIQQIWQRVSEAFSPFDVDVTTEEPSLEDLRNTGGVDSRWGIRVAIGGNSQTMLGVSAGGIAFLGSFDWDSDTPTFVFTDQLGPNDEKFIADATVHEVGHTLTLSHDGRNSPVEEYYAGHGTGATGWAPHMGVGYGKQLVQWSKGEYPAANNMEDDLNRIVTQNGFGYRPDDRGGSAATAAPIMADINGVISDGGVIEQTSDQDWYRFNTAGTTNLTINPAVRGAMLDILAEIYDTNGQLVQSSNPVNQLNASFSAVLPVGTYFLKIDGTGKPANGNDFGYSDYGSIGQYFITGNIQLQPNNPPVVNDQGFTIAENSPNGTVVGTVVATDPNPGQFLAYSITAGNTNNTFAINAATGQITVNDPTLLDFEVPVTFNLTVQVTDDGTPVLNDLATVTIAVTNANEPPVVTGATYFVLEQPPLGIALGTLQAADPDAGQTLTWSITGGNTGNAFAINATTGLITVATPSAIVAATNPTFSLVVQASDNGVPVANGSATVTINVIANNQPPVVADQAFTLPENSAAGTVVGTIVAADPDAGQSIVYAIAGGNAAGAFAINAATGELTIANPAALDFETNPTLSLTVKVTDNVIPGGSDTAVITVNLTNVNDPPAISPATFTVIEFTPNGSLVGTVGATDQDAGQTITYALLSGNAGNVFALDATTGMITIADTTQIDFATVPSYSLMVQATDSGNPAASSTAAITINVSDVNRPPYLPDQAFRVFEGGPPGTLVGTVFTSDPDVGQPQMLSIIGGNVGNAFAIHPTSGKITINNSFAVDFETMPVFNLTVEVRDNSLMPQIKTATMLVEVLDVVEQPMIQPQSFTIAENRPVGYIVGTVVASHFDPMATLTYAITGGNADGIFAINAATGQLKVAKATLNFEATPEMTVTVTVTDDGMPALSRSASMTITVLDLNEAPTFPPATFNISENRPVGYVVGSVKAFDQDVGQSLTYVITGGNTNGTFAINAFTGAITVAKGSLNHEATPQFLLTVSVTDNGTPAQNRSAAVTINILNLNESPVINPQTFTVSENRPVGFVVGQIAAFDQDLGQTLTYAILGGDPNGIFAVNPLGQLVVAKPILNFEAMNAFPLQVSVTDNGSPVQSRSAPITVNVRDLNEAPVVNPQTFTIAEKQPLGASVGTVAAFDQDFNQTLQFAITAGNTSGAFAINAATGQITVANSAAQLFDVNPEFNLTVTVSDNGVPVQSRTAAIKVKLLKVNAKPVVAPQRFSVPENSPAGTNVGTVVATDSDVGQTLKYAITGGNTGGAFAINMTTGQITVANPAAINFETANLFQLTVSATDNGTPVQVGTGMVTIDVLDANDPPIVTNQTFQVAENVPANTLVATVLAQDPEGLPNLKYEIVGGNPNGAFVIDPNTGAVRVSAPFMFDFETNPQLSFLLKVSDSGSPVMSSTATITFQLTNLNDAPVVPTQTFSVSRSANNGATVGTIAASDQDAGQSLRYEIVGGNAGTAFGINLNTGVLFVANRNAFTGRVSIPLTVKVTDNGSNSLSATAGITVNITNGAAVIAKSSGNSGETKFALQGTLASQTVTPSGPAAPVTKPKAAAAATVTADEGANALLQRAVADKVVSKQDA